MYSPDAEFEEHCFYISRDILDWVLHCFSETTYDIITLPTKTEISLKRKKDFKERKMPFFYTLKGLSNKQQLRKWRVFRKIIQNNITLFENKTAICRSKNFKIGLFDGRQKNLRRKEATLGKAT